MDTTISLVRALKARTGIESDYGIAKRLGITRQTVSGYTAAGVTFSDEVALKVAAELGLDPGYVLACMAAERAKRPAQKSAWTALAKRLAHAAMLLICLGFWHSVDADLSTLAAAMAALPCYTLCEVPPAAALFVALAAVRIALKIIRRRP